jgi:RNA polymerase sigma-70 factor, ECF subfamily
VTLTASSTDSRDAQFAAVALPLLPAIHRLARMLVRQEADAEDLVQETFLRAYRFWHTFEPGTDCRSWLATICRRVLFAQKRRKGQLETVEDAELESLHAVQVHKAAVAAGIGDMFARLDLGPAIVDAIRKLDDVYRDVVVLSDVEGFSYEETARALDIPIGTVRSRLYRGRRQLQESLMVFALDAGYGAGGRK